jgi:excinuclease ABC subunit A
MTHFADQPKLRRTLALLDAVGLGYLRLGQPGPTLSGGEAQRLKIAAELCRARTRDVLYVLDEPTTGLHMDDVKKLLAILGRLVDAGNTVIVIEHNLDVIRSADHVVDLGPEGGERGGYVVAEGPPGRIARVEGSYTGAYLRRAFGEELS